MNKLLTISIAAFNVENYIAGALDSLLDNNDAELLEILVEDDGGTDRTAEIVKDYQEKYPEIVKLVHKENGGYGSTINKSLELATGKYFKQLDGDDWFETSNFAAFINQLKSTDADLIYTPIKNFYEVTNTTEINDRLAGVATGCYPLEEVLPKIENHLFLMHTFTYKTSVLRDNAIKITEHCFYTDTEFALLPLMFSNDILILHNPLYVYRIGREGQSVSLVGREKHYEDHMRVSMRFVNFWHENKAAMSSAQRRFYRRMIMAHITSTITNFLLVLNPSKENLQLIQRYEQDIKDVDLDMYLAMPQERKAIHLLRNSKYCMYRPLAFVQRKRFK